MSDRDYDVGYGKPPVSGQFKKGQSGNPKGRKKRNLSFQSLVSKMMSDTVRVNIDGQSKLVTVAEATLLKLRNDMLTGTSAERARALKQLNEYCPGFELAQSNDTASEIRVKIVRSDGDGRLFDATDSEWQLLQALWRMHRAGDIDLANVLHDVGGSINYSAPRLKPIDPDQDAE